MDNADAPDQEHETMTESLVARRVALGLLGQVLDKQQPLDQLLGSDQAYLALSSRDKAFLRMMVATCLRRLGQIDDLIARAADRPESPKPPALHHLLRLAVTQAAFMNVPDYAVVDSAVRLAEQAEMSRQKGFVNAVLRRVAEKGRDWLAGQDEARLNTPDWLMKLWIADYGLRGAAEIALANLCEAPLDISLKDEAARDHWAQALDASPLPTGTLRRVAGGAVQGLPGYDDGMWWVQDAAAALPARLFGDIAGRRVIDMCAAPGGKTAQLVVRGADVTALDRSAARLRVLKTNLERLRLDHAVRVDVADATVWQPPQPFDCILLDAPCSATGTVRRHPDVLRLKTPQDMERLMAVQARLLANAVNCLVPGGLLVYCTCSLQKAEGEQQIAALLETNKALRRVPVDPAEIGGLDALVTPEGDVRVLPYHLAPHGGMDGFYVARLQKTA